MFLPITKLIKPRKKQIFDSDQLLNFEKIQNKLASINIGSSDEWIRIYKKMNSEDLEKLRNYYINRLDDVLVIQFSLRTINNIFSKAWQYYKPLEALSVQESIIELIKNTNHFNSLHDDISDLLQGEIITSAYAKRIVLAILKTYVKASKNLDLNSHGSMDISIHDLGSMTIDIDSEYQYDAALPILNLLENSLSTFKLLMLSMNKQDSDFTQLLLGYIMEPELLDKSPHLDKYMSAISLLTRHMSVQEIVDIINTITTKPEIRPNTKLPEFFIT